LPSHGRHIMDASLVAQWQEVAEVSFYFVMQMVGLMVIGTLGMVAIFVGLCILFDPVRKEQQK